MAFRGYFALNNLELINSSRTAEHLGKVTPRWDYVLGSPGWTCDLTPLTTDAGLFEIPVTSAELEDFPGLYTPPDGSYRYDQGLYEIGDCWLPLPICGCNNIPEITFNDSWPGLKDFLQDTIYRPELAPWYSVTVPQSAEFGGFWVLNAEGFGPTTVQRQITEMVGSGATAGPARDSSKQLTFSTLLIACTNAGLEYGLEWLTCALRTTNTVDGVLQYFRAHPGHSAADPQTLVRQLYNVVLTASPTVSQLFNASGIWHQQATVALVSFSLTALNPYAWYPAVSESVVWDSIATEQISWIPTVPVAGMAPTSCTLSSDCEALTPLLSATCPPEQVVTTTDWPPPVCGGLSVSGIERYIYDVPLSGTPLQCPGTAVTMTITNNAAAPLTALGYWKLAGVPDICSNLDRFPVQINGLPAYASLTLDGISGKYCATQNNKQVRPVGIITTPNGAPWLPPFIDRTQDWQFEILTAPDANFDVVLNLYDQDD